MSIHITYFVHGTTTDNEKHLATGWLPGTLSTLGKEQSEKLGKQVADQHFDIVFCSDLQRAIESAALQFEDKQYQIVQDKRLRECNYGQLNGGPEHIVKARMSDFIDQPFPGGESYRDTEKRLASFLVYLQEHYDGKRVAVVAHQAPQLALDVLLKGKTWQQAIDEDWRKKKAWQPGWTYRIP